MSRRLAAALTALPIVALAACEQVEQVQDRFRDLTPHEAYQESLVASGLDQTALGRDWLTAGRLSMAQAAAVPLPFEEAGFITAEEPGAMAYRISVERGQKLTAEVTLDGEEDTKLFVDLFRVAASEDDAPRPVFSTDSLPGVFVHEPWRGGEFILRLQPELLRGGQFRVRLAVDRQLAFPVEGHDMPAVQSRFGAARDGGARSHHGVDIFARRGTPVLAASAGTVNRVEVTNLGGKVVWLSDPVRNASLYYAHLDSQYVSRGQRLQPGDTVGFVGNTGNARTTPPHLHFGVYRRGEGPIDPAPFLQRPRGRLAELTVDLDRLGGWMRLSSDGIRLRAAPGTSAPILSELGRHTPLRVLGGSGAFYRVRLPDGSTGYVAGQLTEPLAEPVEAQVALAGTPVLAGPDGAAPVMATLDDGEEVPVLGRYAGYLYVMAPDGRPGWMAAAAQQQ